MSQKLTYYRFQATVRKCLHGVVGAVESKSGLPRNLKLEQTSIVTRYAQELTISRSSLNVLE